MLNTNLIAWFLNGQLHLNISLKHLSNQYKICDEMLIGQEML